jgi:uncharacterized protein (TIGR02646 family)
LIRLPDVALPEATQRYLEKAQATLEAKGDRAAQSAAVEALWKAKQKTKSFAPVKAALKEMCSDPTERCHYCEDAPVSGIDHFRPKTLYPEWAFLWENFVYACQNCNGAKSNVFPLEDDQPLLIDPRSEDPMQFLSLDILNTFWFSPHHSLKQNDFGRRRAEETIKILTLNSRGAQVRGRRGAFNSYRARLREYTALRDIGEPTKHLVNDWYEVGHITVWREMQRWYSIERLRNRHPELATLFATAPEALTW